MNTKIMGSKSVGLMVILVMLGNLMLVPMVHQARADTMRPGADGKVEKSSGWGLNAMAFGGVAGAGIGWLAGASGIIGGSLMGPGSFLFLGPMGWSILAGAAAAFLIAHMIQKLGQNLAADLHNNRMDKSGTVLGVPMGGAAPADPR